MVKLYTLLQNICSDANNVPKMEISKELGRSGEDIAAEYLENKGVKVLYRNWRFQRLEIDIIALDGKYLVFTEVKTRSGISHGEAVDAVNRKKQRQIIRAANAFYKKYNRMEEARFDIIGIRQHQGYPPEIKHLKDAFYPLV